MLSDVALLERLVALPSVSRDGNREIADFACSYLDEGGIAVERDEADGGRRVNVIARVGPERGDDRGLVLSGHLDVVPADEPDWTSDPFTLVERDGSLYGRGSADMKGFIALALNLARRLARERLVAPLALVLTRDEELGALGAGALVERWGGRAPLPRATVVGEPTELRVVRLHKGHLRVSVVVRGKSAHSGFPHRGENAIEKAARIVVAFGALREALAAERTDSSAHFPDVPFVTLNVGRIAGGSAVNVIPERVEMELGLRPLPGVDGAELVRRVRAAAEGAAGAGGVEVGVIHETPTLSTAADAEIHRACSALVGQQETVSAAFASDAGELSRAGLETVLWGPGSIEVAHRPDEHVPLAGLARASQLLSRLAGRFCGPEAGRG